MFGQSPRLPIVLPVDLDNGPQQGDYQDYVKTWQAGMKQAYDIAYRNTRKSSTRSKAYYDKKASNAEMLPDDRVLVRNLAEREGPGKLRSYREEQIYVVDEHIFDSPVYRVKLEHDRGKQGVLHRNLLLVMLNKIARDSRPGAHNRDLDRHLNLKTPERVVMIKTKWTHRATQPPTT